MQADRGRCQMQGGGGLGEGTELGDRHQGAQPVEIDFTHGK
ncbi:Uncharacterised protein [Bordetella trematum]|nr:Uncharacterised protein [Bordetella trematum]